MPWATASTSCCAATTQRRWRGDMGLRQTPSQTVGPFFSKALIREGWNDLAARGASGQPLVIAGRVLDGEGAPVPDAPRRATLIARPAGGKAEPVLHFDLVLQGDNETVFFDI